MVQRRLVVFGACLGLWAVPALAQRGAKLAGVRGAPSVQALLVAPAEAEKDHIFMQLRRQLTPGDAFAIVQKERSDAVAAMAAGACLERLSPQPREAAQVLYSLAQRPGQAGLAAMLGATSGSAGTIAAELASVESRGKLAGPRLLAADMLAIYGRLAADRERAAHSAANGEAASATGADEEVGGKRGRKRGKQLVRIAEPDAELTAPLEKLLSSKEPDVLEAAVLAAAWLRCDAVRAKVEQLREVRAPAVLAATLLYHARTGAEVPDTLVRKVFGQSPTANPRFVELSPALASFEIRTSPWAYGCEALGELREPMYLPQLEAALNHRDLRVQIEAARALERGGAPESLRALLKKVAAPRTPWPVLAAALSAAGAIPSPDSIPVLVERLRRETGRFRLDVNYALASITGSQHGTTADEWNAWWQDHRDQFAPDAERTTRFRQAKQVQDMRVWPLGLFYNLELYSDRLVFVLDTSNSMHGARIASLKQNLTNTLQGLNPNARFNLVDFGGRLSLLRTGGLIPASEAPAVVPRVEGMSLSLGTRTYDALELATQLPDVDTLVLMSDGAPVAGKFEAWPRIMAAVQILNRYRPLAIWGLEFDARERNLGGMRELTDRNAGHTRSSKP